MWQEQEVIKAKLTKKRITKPLIYSQNYNQLLAHDVKYTFIKTLFIKLDTVQYTLLMYYGLFISAAPPFS